MTHLSRTRSLTALAAVAAMAVALPSTATASNDPLYGSQWGPQQVNADDVWSTTTGAGATIAIVDSGVDLQHEDLAGNLVRGNTFIDCGANGCGDGDWESGDGAGDPHGTHVAGIAAAIAGNGVGIAGVAPDATILPVKVLDQDGSGSFEDIGYGIRWAADQGADVINLSLGALPGVQALEVTGIISDARDAIVYARSKGSVVVVASGNESFPLCGSPSFTDGALCVTATDRREQHSWYSNGGLKPDLKAVAAPGGAGTSVLCGEDVVSTVPAGEGGDYCGYPANRAYDEYAGTSMAAPHVAGVAGLLASLGCSGTEIEDLLTSTARDPLTTVTGTWDPVYGWGIVDAQAAVAAASCSGSTGGDTGGGDTGGGGNDKPKGGKGGGGKGPKA